MPHFESGVVWGTVARRRALRILNALGVDIGLSPFFGILLLVAEPGAVPVPGWKWLPGAVDGRGASRPDGISPIWACVGHTLAHRWAVLVLDALGLEIVSVAFWGLVMLVIGALMLRRAPGGRSDR